MRKVSYFPGCTLKSQGKELEASAKASAKALGIELEEIEEWQCCGGVFTTANDEIATKLSSVRALTEAKRKGQALVTVCSGCHNVIKQTNYAMQNDAAFAMQVNRYLKEEEAYHGETQVMHYLELLRDVVGYDKIREQVSMNENNPIKGKRIGAYYGCLLLRPNHIMRMDDPENPSLLEDLIRAMGGEPVVYPYRNECCGGYVVLENETSAEKKSHAILESARKAGAEMVVTACPLCRYNLEKHRGADGIATEYFTKLLAEALGVTPDKEQTKEAE